MRSLGLLVCCATVLVAASPAQGADLATGLVGYWKLDETSAAGAALDSSATGASGAYVNGPTPTTDVPAVGYADRGSVLLSRASMQAVRVQNVPAALKPPAVTLAAWFRVRMTVTNQGSGQGFSDIVSVGDQTMLRVYAARVETAKRVAGGAWATINATVTPGTNVWHHLAATMDGTRVTLYFDGASVATMADARPISYDLGPDLWIGRHGSGTMMRDFDGNIDEVAVWSRVLTAAEIDELAEGAQPGTGAAPVDAGRPPPDAGAGGASGAGGSTAGAGGSTAGAGGSTAGAGGSTAGAGGSTAGAGGAGAGGAGAGGRGGSGGATGAGGGAGAGAPADSGAGPDRAALPDTGVTDTRPTPPLDDGAAPRDDAAVPSPDVASPADADVTADAGADATPTGAGGSTGAGSADARADQASSYRADGSRPAPPSGGCGCATAPGAAWPSLLIGLALLATRARRRRRRRRR